MLKFIKNNYLLLLFILTLFIFFYYFIVNDLEISKALKERAINEQRWKCTERELTSYDFDIFKLEFEKSIKKLWLNNWKVIYTFWESRDWWWRARFIDNSDETSHYAVVELNKYWTCWVEPYSEESIRWLARHEVWHLVVADLVKELENWKDEDDIYEEEKVAHTIANLLE